MADLYVYNRATSVVTLVTAAADGTATGTSPGLLTGASADLSDDCSTVAFTVPADTAGTGGAVVAGTGGMAGSYVRTLATGRTRRVSVDSAGRPLATPLTGMQLSAHARSLVFATAQPGVVAGDTNGSPTCSCATSASAARSASRCPTAACARGAATGRATAPPTARS